MVYTPATKLPTDSELKIAQWSTPTNPRPTLARGIDSDDTTIYFTVAPLDRSDAVVTAPILAGCKVLSGTKAGYIEGIYLPNGADGASGLSATGAIRGVRLDGIDYTTGDSTLAVDHNAGDPIFFLDATVFQQLLVKALQGDVATGGIGITFGTEGGDGTETITVYRSTGAGTKKGFLRWLTGDAKVQFSNDGTTWTSIDDTVSSVLFKVSSNDTTPGYAEDKIVAGDNVTITTLNDGANETLQIAATSQREGVTTHIIYTPAFLTSGASVETTIALWDSVTDGSFRATDVDGTPYNVDGLDFSATGPLGIVTDMDDVAAVIQQGLRAATGGSETVVWNGTRIVFTSADTTASSNFAVLTTSTGTVGTDISGAGAGTWLDSDTGNGVATAAVVDPTADTGKVPLLNANGNVDTDLLQEVIPTGGYTAKGELVVGSAADTPTLLSIGSDGTVPVAASGETSGIKWVEPVFAAVDTTNAISSTSNEELTFTPGFEAGVIEIHLPGITLDGATNPAYVSGVLVFDQTTFKFARDLYLNSATTDIVNYRLIEDFAIRTSNQTYSSVGSSKWDLVISVSSVTSTQFTVRLAATKTSSPADIAALNIGVIARP